MPTPGGVIVLDPGSLDENALPRRLVGRDDELAKVVAALRTPAPGNGHVWLHGASGAGKTCLALHAIATVGLKSVHVSCRTARSAFRVLDAAVDQLRLLPSELTRERETRLRALRAGIRGRFAFLLDDADALPERELEYLLHGLSELSGASVVATAGGTGPLDAFHERLPSHFLPKVVEVRPLHAELLAEALADRARFGLAEGTWSDVVVQAVARAAAGDGKLAVQALRRAANFAEFKRLTRLDEHTVQVTLTELRQLRQAGILGRLTAYHRTLYQIVCGQPGLCANDVRRELAIALVAQDLPAIAERTVRKYLNDDLVPLGLVRFQRTGLRGNVFRYWPVDGGTGDRGSSS